MSLNCGHCGRFAAYETGDEFTEWGLSGDMEPPDPTILCQECSKEIEDEIAELKEPAIPHTPWIPGRCHEKGMNRAGLIWVSPVGAAWARPAWPHLIPEGYVAAPREAHG
jgi:hypothetical protein